MVKFAAPLLLVCVLCFTAGQVSAFGPVDSTAQVDSCCNQGNEAPQKTSEGECNDPGCLCTSCVDLTLWDLPQLNPTSQPLNVPAMGLSFARPSGHIRTIEYPPELS